MRRLKRYLNYYRKAETIHKVHSPFLYSFLGFVCDPDRIYYDFRTLDRMRRRLVRWTDNDHNVHVDSFPNNTAEKLYRILIYLKPSSIMELGSHSALSTHYIRLARPGVQVYTNAEEKLSAIFKRLIPTKINIDNINFISNDEIKNFTRDTDALIIHPNATPSFDKPIPEIFSLDTKNLIVIIGLHTSDANQILWRHLKTNSRFNIKIDLYDIGILINRPELDSKINFTYIEYYKKWWQVGFF